MLTKNSIPNPQNVNQRRNARSKTMLKVQKPKNVDQKNYP